MDKVGKYCRELSKEYEKEGINSAKAAAYRKKILKMLLDCDSDDESGKTLEMYWRSAYYNPLASLRSKKNADDNSLTSMVHIFCGELHGQLINPSRNSALYNMYLGDLHRYIPDASESKLSGVYYKRAVEANPELGHAFNQLALKVEHIQAVRYFLLALSAGSPFKASIDNLDRQLDENIGVPLIDIVFDIITVSLIAYSKFELVEHGAKWEAELRGTNDVLSVTRAPLIVHSLALTSVLVADRVNDECFLSMTSIVCDTLMYLLRQIVVPHLVDDDDEEEEMRAVAARRRRARRSSEEDDSSDNTDEERATTAPISIPPHSGNRTGALHVWPLAVSCEWLLKTTNILAELRERKIPIPGALTDALDRFVGSLIDKLNSFVKSMNFSTEEAAEETRWLLNGPVDGTDEESGIRSLAQVSYWAQQMVYAETSSVELTTYFRRKKRAGGAQSPSISSLQRKMGELLKERVSGDGAVVVSNGNTDWLPVYIVLDYAVLADHLGVLRQLVASKHVIPIVPSFVLAQLDKMKGTGPNIRSAMRFIEQRQSHDELRVEQSASHSECCSRLAASMGKEAAAGGLAATVALLVTDIEQYHSMQIPGVAIYHIESFWDRWNKTVR